MPSAHTINFPDDPDPLARYRREYEQQEAELARQRRQEERERQRSASQVALAPDDYWAEVDRRIEEKLNAAIETVGKAVGELLDKQHESLQSALDRRDAKIEALHHEIEIKVGLRRRLDRLQSEITAARQQAPDFKAELDGLREKVAKQEKLITRLRGEQSILDYAQKELAAEQRKSRHEISVTAIEVTSIGGATREVLERLRAEGIDFIEEWAPSGLAS
jgi:predicted  nucleic acid-binding Zn-ribbon protein